MKMPFGKHKGKELDDIISRHPSYIVWLAENCKLKGELRTIVRNNYEECLESVFTDTYRGDPLSPSGNETWVPNFGWVGNDDYGYGGDDGPF